MKVNSENSWAPHPVFKLSTFNASGSSTQQADNLNHQTTQMPGLFYSSKNFIYFKIVHVSLQISDSTNAERFIFLILFKYVNIGVYPRGSVAPPPGVWENLVSGQIKCIFRAKWSSGLLEIHLDNLKTIRSGDLKQLPGPSIQVSRLHFQGDVVRYAYGCYHIPTIFVLNLVTFEHT